MTMLFKRALRSWRCAVEYWDRNIPLSGITNLALLYQAQHKYEQAEPLFAKVVEVQQRAIGATRSSTLKSVTNLAGLYWEQGRYTQAEIMLRQALNGYANTISNT
jgi:tetratricopeptide (TPR) repeat protein